MNWGQFEDPLFYLTFLALKFLTLRVVGLNTDVLIVIKIIKMNCHSVH